MHRKNFFLLFFFSVRVRTATPAGFYKRVHGYEGLVELGAAHRDVCLLQHYEAPPSPSPPSSATSPGSSHDERRTTSEASRSCPEV